MNTVGDQPWRLSARREVQSSPTDVGRSSNDSMSVPIGDGFGLLLRIDLEIGSAVGHRAGPPGRGSNMRWGKACGVGVIGPANVTKAPQPIFTQRVLTPRPRAARADMAFSESPAFRSDRGRATGEVRSSNRIAGSVSVRFGSRILEIAYGPSLAVGSIRDDTCKES